MAVTTQSQPITTQTETRSPFANQSWEQVKESIKSWIRTEREPGDVDVEMLAAYLRQLALDRRIEILGAACNFLHRSV